MTQSSRSIDISAFSQPVRFDWGTMYNFRTGEIHLLSRIDMEKQDLSAYIPQESYYQNMYYSMVANGTNAVSVAAEVIRKRSDASSPSIERTIEKMGDFSTSFSTLGDKAREAAQAMIRIFDIKSHT